MELKKILRNPNTYIYLGSAVVVIGLILVLTHKKAAAAPVSGEPVTPAKPSPVITTGGVPVLITNFDAVYDYKLEKGVWYTKKKTSTSWLNMKDSLSAAAYTTAIAKLTAFLNK